KYSSRSDFIAKNMSTFEWLDVFHDLFRRSQELMNTLKRRVTRKRHVNVLQHIMGYLKQHISRDDKAELTASIESYRRGETPLIVPITLLRHYFRHHPDSYMSKQVYLQPHPDSLGLRNSI
ncbi:MAG: YbgA family protein, partial [Candidatus Thiodiazotropha endolucinida]